MKGILDLRPGISENGQDGGIRMGSKGKEVPPVFEHNLKFGGRKVYGFRGTPWEI